MAERRAAEGRAAEGRPAQGRVAPRSQASTRPRAAVDPARLAAYQLLRTVDEDAAYANLALPRLLADAGLSGRNAAFATELGYGTLRALGVLDEILARCADRPLGDVQPAVLDLLRLGAYQLLRTRVPPHAAVATSVDLAPTVGLGRAGCFVNAVLRKAAVHDWAGWTDALAAGRDPLAASALRSAHPRWIAAAFADALGEDAAGPLAQTTHALGADDTRPSTHLVAWPGRSDVQELLDAVGGERGPYSPYAVRMSGGDPSGVAAVRERRAAVQDEGSQLCALALANAPLEGRDSEWLDLCAGPGGKAALLAAVAAERGAGLRANELWAHRAELVRAATGPWHVDVRVGDARSYPARPGGFDRVMLDVPCTGLGALRRRPEARWRRTAEDVGQLVALQGELLAAALRLVRPGGVVAYVTCSPHLAETAGVIASHATGHELIDARPFFPALDLGPGPAVQLWPHRHGTDAMFCALLRG